MGDLSYDEFNKRRKKIPGVGVKINKWTNNIKNLKSKSNFKKSHYVALFGDGLRKGILNMSLLEVLGFEDLKPAKNLPKEKDYYTRCENYIDKMCEELPKALKYKDGAWRTYDADNVKEVRTVNTRYLPAAWGNCESSVATNAIPDGGECGADWIEKRLDECEEMWNEVYAPLKAAKDALKGLHS